ncbi:hypothetical protein C5K25_20170 [Shigella dysenteriae]|nr:hypothetical protein C5K25_20170 [Shigella dysenteriae]
MLKLQDPGFGTRRYSDDAYIQSQLADFCPDGMPDTASMKTDPELRMEVERQFSWWVFNHMR